MGVSEIILSIDREIAQLKQARSLLGGGPVVLPKSASARQSHAPAGKNPAKRRVLSPEGRKRIADAQKKRWAAQKKTAASAQK
jgi:hypothetical protein